MQRRDLLKATMALAAYTGIPVGSLYAARAMAQIADGQAEPFSFAILQERAKKLAGQAYVNHAQTLPPTLAQMDPLQFNAIHYDAKRSLWAHRHGQLDVQFFHVGMGFKLPVRMHSLDPKTGQAREVHFHPDLFSYDKSGVNVSQLQGKDFGFAGFKVFKQPNLADKDLVSFIGASYFRAADHSGHYGLSARGLAVNTFAGGGPEEFPDFVEFWLETPAINSDRFVLYALLDGPSITGAYRFNIDIRNRGVVMEVDSHLYPRTAIKQLGIAPMSSMFACGSYERMRCDFINPNIHDTDRLDMWRGNGEWICRPLNNPKSVQFNAFEDENPRGFGLVQQDHDFDTYRDKVNGYDRRPSLWVEPTSAWGKGSIALMELPTTGETLDNIVAFWNPAEPVQAGKALHFGYRLHWAALPPVRPGLAWVLATRSGMGGSRQGWAPGEHWPDVWARRFAVEFVGGPLERMKWTDPIEPVISVSHGQAKDIQVFALHPEIKGFRAQFDWYPTDDSTDPVIMRLYIRNGQTKEVLSETWLYEYFPPPANKRNYSDAW